MVIMCTRELVLVYSVHLLALQYWEILVMKCTDGEQPDEDCPHVRFDKGGVSHVAHPASETIENCVLNVFLPLERDGRTTGWPHFEFEEQQTRKVIKSPIKAGGF